MVKVEIGVTYNLHFRHAHFNLHFLQLPTEDMHMIVNVIYLQMYNICNAL